jgi:hypothetical protein
MFFKDCSRSLVGGIALLLAPLLICYASAAVAADSMAPTFIDLEQKNAEVDMGGKLTPPLIKQTVSMDADLLPIATTIGITDYVTRLPQLRQRLSDMGPTNNLERLTARQDLLETQEQLMRSVFKANMEVDYMLARIDAETNIFSQLLQDLTSKRDKDVMVSSILAQLTNAALWSLSCSYTYASVHHPSYSYTDGVVGIAAGLVPSAFSLYALYQLQGPKRNLRVDPNILNPMFATPVSADVDYPAVVKTYLSERPAGRTFGPTRKERILQLWHEKGYLPSSSNKHLFEEKEDILAGTISKKAALTIKMLQIRLLMLSDLRCEVIQLKKQFLGLTNVADAK